METGTLQRRWSKEMPIEYDREYRIVRFDIKNEKGNDGDNSEVDGYSYIEVQLDKVIDYGHIKSQLIESGYAQKDEFGLLMNAVGDIVKAIESSNSFAEIKSSVSSEDLVRFKDFILFREMCANVAKKVMNYYK